MATSAQVALGTTLKYWDTVSSAWTEITEVTNLSWDGPTRETIEVSKLNTADEYMNKLQGMLNAGTVTATVLYVKAQYETLRTQMETRGNVMYQIALPNGEGLEFEGFITELPMDMSTTDAIQGDVVFEIDGKADFLSAVT